MSSATTGGSADELSQASAPTATVRLYLRASNLPKSLTGQRPDTLARVSLLPPRTGLPPPPMIGVDGDGDGGGAAEEGEEAAGETEVGRGDGSTRGRRCALRCVRSPASERETDCGTVAILDLNFTAVV